MSRFYVCNNNKIYLIYVVSKIRKILFDIHGIFIHSLLYLNFTYKFNRYFLQVEKFVNLSTLQLKKNVLTISIHSYGGEPIVRYNRYCDVNATCLGTKVLSSWNSRRYAEERFRVSR